MVCRSAYNHKNANKHMPIKRKYIFFILHMKIPLLTSKKEKRGKLHESSRNISSKIRSNGPDQAFENNEYQKFQALRMRNYQLFCRREIAIP